MLSGVRPAADIAAVVLELQALGQPRDYWPPTSRVATRARRSPTRCGRATARSNALVNNAGRAPRVRADLLDASEESFEEVMRTNLQGPYFLTQELSRDMVARRAGRRRRSAPPSSSSRRCRRRWRRSTAASTASARRAWRWRRSCSPCGSRRRIPVYEVRPGIIGTDMTAGVREVYDQRIADGLVPEAPVGQPEDVGRAVAALVARRPAVRDRQRHSHRRRVGDPETLETQFIYRHPVCIYQCVWGPSPNALARRLRAALGPQALLSLSPVSILSLSWGPPPPRANHPCALRRDRAVAPLAWASATSEGGHPHDAASARFARAGGY